MTPNITTIRRRVAPALLVVLLLPGEAPAQTTITSTTTTQGNLALGESSGPPKGYAFLLPPPTSRVPEVFVQLTPEDDLIPPDQWTWKVVTTDNDLKSALTLRWYAQAACPDDLTSLQVIGPGGTLTQNPLWNPIWGYFKTQSFTVDTIKDVCLNWANDDENACDPADPGEGCAVYETFNLTGGVLPAGPADRLRLKASCTSGPLPDTYYAASVRLRCDRGSY